MSPTNNPFCEVDQVEEGQGLVIKGPFWSSFKRLRGVFEGTKLKF